MQKSAILIRYKNKKYGKHFHSGNAPTPLPLGSCNRNNPPFEPLTHGCGLKTNRECGILEAPSTVAGMSSEILLQGKRLQKLEVSIQNRILPP